MCGIIGYVGFRKAVPILLEGLKRLEYRGYDSAGITFMEKNQLKVRRCKGKLANLIQMLGDCRDLPCFIGLGHTRWATHGKPNERNAHPHLDCSGELILVHNGIIENYYELKETLIGRGHHFASETDTEVLAHLIEEQLNGDLMGAVTRALKEVKGSYAIGVMWSLSPEEIVAARNQSPLVIGIGENEAFLASDVPAFLPWTKSAIFLNDGEIASLSRNDIRVFSLTNGAARRKPIQTISWDASMAEVGGYDHYMLKEIYEQPQAIMDTIKERLNWETGEVSLPEAGLTRKDVQSIEKVLFLACGTSYHAALIGRFLIQRWTRIPVEVELGSEFRYSDNMINRHVLAIPITQSGETADTLASMKMAKELGSKTIAICNVLGSSAARESDGTIYTHAGPEIGVASTKAFTSQLTALLLLTLFLAQKRKSIADSDCVEMAKNLRLLPFLLKTNMADLHGSVKEIANRSHLSSNFLYLGRNILYPIALEGALKLKEISYIHAEGYAAGEMKHGPIALIDHDLPTVALVPRDHVYEKMTSNIEEVKSRDGQLIVLGEQGDKNLQNLADHFIPLPKTSWEISPILYTIPLQLLAYEIAVLRGCDVDKPRNLAKSVTVE